MGRGSRRSRLILILSAGYLLFLLSITLFTHNYYTYGRSSNLLPFGSIRLMLESGSILLILKNVIGNMALFVPVGLLFPVLIGQGRAIRTAVFSAFLLSLLIEVCQYLFAARIFDVDDLLLNVAGALVGAGLLHMCRWLNRKVVCFFIR